MKKLANVRVCCLLPIFVLVTTTCTAQEKENDLPENGKMNEVELILNRLEAIDNSEICSMNSRLSGKLVCRIKTGFKPDSTEQENADKLSFNSFVKSGDDVFLANVAGEKILGAMPRVVSELPSVDELNQCKSLAEIETIAGEFESLQQTNDFGWASNGVKFYQRTWVQCVLDSSKNEVKYVSVLATIAHRDGEKEDSVANLIVNDATLKPNVDKREADKNNGSGANQSK